MNKLIFFLLFQLLLLLILIFLNRKKWNFKLSNLKLAMIASLLFYFSIIILVVFTNYILKNKLNSFDLNHDGNFSLNEQTIEQQKAMKAVITDTGRNLAPIIGIIYSIFYFVIILIPLLVFNRKKTFDKNEGNTI